MIPPHQGWPPFRDRPASLAVVGERNPGRSDPVIPLYDIFRASLLGFLTPGATVYLAGIVWSDSGVERF